MLRRWNISKINTAMALTAVANFMLAFGGGSIMRQQRGFDQALGEEILDIPVFAILCGSVVGVLVLRLFTWEKLRNLYGVRTFGDAFASAGGAVTSVGCALVSGLLLLLLNTPPPVNYRLFLILLSLRFGLWYVTRSLRSDAAAGRNQKLAWVDLLFYLGLILGLIVWEHSEMDPSLLLRLVLVFDVGLQLLGGCLDYVTSRILRANEIHITTDGNPVRLSSFPLAQYIHLSVAMVALTIGTQIVMLEFRHVIGNRPKPLDDPIGSYAFVSIYSAGALAALVYARTKFQLGWRERAGHWYSRAVIIIGGSARGKCLPFDGLSGLSAALLITALVTNIFWWAPAKPILGLRDCTLFVLLAASIFVYELLALSIFDYLGKRAKESGKGGFVALTVMLMGLGGAAHYLLFLKLVDLKLVETEPAKHYAWILTAVAAIIVASVNIRAAGNSSGEQSANPLAAKPSELFKVN